MARAVSLDETIRYESIEFNREEEDIDPRCSDDACNSSDVETSNGEFASKDETRSSRRCIALLPSCSPTLHLLSNAHLFEMCHKLSANIHHYSSFFHDLASPIIARCSRWRSRSQTREESAPSDAIELCHMSGFLLKAVKSGDQGHKFVTVTIQSPTWCDACGKTVIGLYKRFLRCKICSYTCHMTCRSSISVVCPDLSDSGHRPTVFRETSLSEHVLQNSSNHSDNERENLQTQISNMSSASTLSSSSFSSSSKEVNTLITRFNENKHGLVMQLVDDEFRGFIRVHLNLCRPISMCLSARPPSLYDILTHSEPVLDYKQITSFYLPQNTSTVLHIKETTTVQDVISILLHKFNITDDPRKFSLYHRSQKLSQNSMRKLGIYELPLILSLYWTSQGPNALDANMFILQENDCGEIVWDVFSIPELENFLAILKREEEEYLDRLKYKYRLVRIHAQRRLKQLRAENLADRKNVLDCL